MGELDLVDCVVTWALSELEDREIISLHQINVEGNMPGKILTSDGSEMNSWSLYEIVQK